MGSMKQRTGWSTGGRRRTLLLCGSSYVRGAGGTSQGWPSADGSRWRTSDEAAHGVAVSGNERIDVDQVRNTFRKVGERSRHDGTAVREADEDELVEILVQHVVDDIGDVRSARRLAR